MLIAGLFCFVEHSHSQYIIYKYTMYVSLVMPRGFQKIIDPPTTVVAAAKLIVPFLLILYADHHFLS